MAYSCNTCGKMHATNEICSEPMPHYIRVTDQNIKTLAERIRYWWGAPKFNLEQYIKTYLQIGERNVKAE